MPDGHNIWMINHYAGNLQLGMEYRHFLLGRHLAALGHRPCIIAASFHHLYTTPPSFAGPIGFDHVDGVDFCWLRTPDYRANGIRRLWNTVRFSHALNVRYREIEEKFGPPDVVLGSSPHPFVVRNLNHLKHVYSVPTIFEVRDLWPQMLIELGSLSRRHPLTWLFGRLEQQGFTQSDRVISLWRNADPYMFAHGLDPKRYVYLPNGIEMPKAGEQPRMDFTHPLIELVRERKRAGKFLVGYGGSHGLANPLDCMLDTCRLLLERNERDIEFFLVGDGPSKADLVRRARQLQLPNIHFHDYVHKDVILAFYHEIDAAFMGLRDLPLFKYGPTPNKLMDYFLMSKPIIYAIRSEYKPVEEAGAGITIEPDDPEALADAALRLRAMQPCDLQELGRAGYHYAERELNFEVLARKLADVIDQCVQANRSTSHRTRAA